jgi:tetratricopeptide (TPR) repeat protein
LGILLEQRSQLEQAKEHLTKAVAADPNYAFARANLARILRRLGDLSASEEQVHAALKLGPDAWIINEFNHTRQWRTFGERLAGVRSGADKPEGRGELLEIARYCAAPKIAEYELAQRLFLEAYSKDEAPVADDYIIAARVALALAEDAKSAPEMQSQHRAQAIAWLERQRVLLVKSADSKPVGNRERAASRLDVLLADETFKSLRDPASLEKLPAAERAAAEGFWQRMRELRESMKTE